MVSLFHWCMKICRKVNKETVTLGVCRRMPLCWEKPVTILTHSNGLSAKHLNLTWLNCMACRCITIMPIHAIHSQSRLHTLSPAGQTQRRCGRPRDTIPFIANSDYNTAVWSSICICERVGPAQHWHEPLFCLTSAGLVVTLKTAGRRQHNKPLKAGPDPQNRLHNVSTQSLY